MDRRTLGGVVLLGANLAGAAIFALLMLALSEFQADLRGELTRIGMKVMGTHFPATLIDEKRARLQSTVWSAGEKLYLEKPGLFSDRIASYWDVENSPYTH